MARLTRRHFLGSTLAAAGAVALPRRKVLGNVLGANNKVRIAVAGFNGRGESHIAAWVAMKDVELVYLIDPDTRIWDKNVKSVDQKTGKKPQMLKDVRKALEDKDLDAISIATPNHWHALMTVWGCQAGKHVYVEKPMCHNALEGAVAVEAARKYKRVVQHGTQSRSDPGWAEAVAVGKSGKLGKLQLLRGLCYKDGGTGWSTRGDIGFAKPADPPKELDFDLWLGPAPHQPYNANLVPYRWHWFWDFGNGDMGNQGVHQMDVLHWAIPEDSPRLPQAVVSAGGRFKFKDQGQVPNTLVTIFDYDGFTAIFETRGLKSQKFEGCDVGNIMVYEGGEIRGGKPQFFPRENGKLAEKPVPMPEVPFHVATGGPFRSFIEAVRADDINKSNAPAEKAFYSCALIHLGNASYRLGQKTAFDKKKNAFVDNPAASETFARMEKNLVDNGVTLADTEYVLGEHLTLPNQSDWTTTNKKANALLNGDHQYREPFALPGNLVAQG